MFIRPMSCTVPWMGNILGNQNTARRAHAHDSGRDVHAVAVYALVIKGDLALVDADAKRHVFAKSLLDVDGSGHCSHGTWERAETPITEVLNEFSPVCSDRSFQRFPVTEPNDSGGLFVLLHDGRVPDHIREHHGGESAAAIFGHAANMRLRVADREQILLQQHQRQPQREQRAHDDHAHEAHLAEGLLLNVGDTEQESHA